MRSGAPVLREHAPGPRETRDVRRNDRAARPELLHPVPRAEEHGRGARTWAKRSRAIFFPAKMWNCSRRWPATRHRDPECAAVCVAGTEGRRYERLKDFNENIVESINVGVLAVDLADRVESWNSQMEVMYALPRWQALTRPLSEVFPAEFRGRVLPGAAESGHSQSLQVPPGDSNRRDAHGQRGDRAAGHQEIQRDRAADHHGRHHRARGARSATFAGRQAFVHRPAGGGRRARSQYAAGGDLVVRADAFEAVAGRRDRNRACSRRSRGRRSARRRSSTTC